MTTTFGRCHQDIIHDSGTVLQCKCLGFRYIAGNYLCACCNHDRNYHEHEPMPVPEFDLLELDFIQSHFQTQVPAELTSQSLSQTQVPAELTSQSLSQTQFFQSLTSQSLIQAQVPAELNSRSHYQTQVPAELTSRSHSQKNSQRNEFRLINLSNVGPNPKIPRSGIENLEREGKSKQICFTGNSSINNIVETSFPCLGGQSWKFYCCEQNSTSVLKMADIPEGGWNIDRLRRISGSRKKLYVGVPNTVPTVVPHQMTASNAQQFTDYNE